jgi:hypothetical protein
MGRLPSDMRLRSKRFASVVVRRLLRLPATPSTSIVGVAIVVSCQRNRVSCAGGVGSRSV